MKDIVFAYYNLKKEIRENIEDVLNIKLLDYNFSAIPNVLFCDVFEELEESFLEELFLKQVILIRVSDNFYNPLAFTINNDRYDIYENNFGDKEFIKFNRSNMDIFKTRLEKVLELNVTPSFLDIPNSVNLTDIKDYISRMVNYIEYINMTEIDHSIRVAEYAKLLAEKINYDDPNLLYVAGLLHDIGKSLIPNDIRLARRKLTQLEYEHMKQHPTYSYYLLNKELYNPIRDIILYHHERCDGSGYPKGIKDIPLGAKILAIVDSYDAMTSSRIYDIDIKSVDKSLKDLDECAEKGLYDKLLVKEFIKIIKNN